MAEIDYSKIPDKDLEILATGNYEGVSELTLQYMAGQSGSSFDAFTSNAGRGLTSSLRGLGILQPDEEADLQSEQESRMRLETNPIAGWSGLLIGSALDPVTLPAAILKPLAIGGRVLTGALRGSAGGAFGGLVDPVYEGMGDSRAMNVTGGAVLGGALGGLVGRLFGKAAPKAEVEGKATEAEVDAAKILESDDPAKAIDEVAAKAEEPAIPESAVFNKESGVFETMAEETPIVNFAMPQQLAGAKPRFNKFTTGFENDIDKALYIVGNSTSKSSNHDAYVDWLKGVTGLDDASVLAAARSSRGELVRSFGRATPDAKGNLLAEPSTFSQNIRQQLSAPKQVGTPVKPTVTVKDGLDDKDLALLEKAGVKIIVGRDGSLVVQDKFAPANASMMSNQTFLSRMEAAGIGIDIPAFRKRTKADAVAGQAAEREQMMTPEFWSRQEPPSADRAPVFDRQEWTGVQQMTPETRAAWTRPPRPTNQAPSMEGLQTGAPREGDAAGATRAKPSSIYGSDLAPGLSKMSPTELAARASMIEPEEVLRMMPPSERAALEAKYPSGLAEYISQGQVRLKEILRKNNNIVEWMISKSRATRGMSESEVGAFTPFYHQAMAAREQVLDRAVAHRAAGGSFESGEGAQLAQDILYYTGIALFKKNEGSKAGRALNAFRLLSERARKGQPIKNIFPGVAC